MNKNTDDELQKHIKVMCMCNNYNITNFTMSYHKYSRKKTSRRCLSIYRYVNMCINGFKN